MISYKKSVYFSGARYIVIYAQTPSGRLPAKQFFNSIGPPDWGKLDRVLKRLATAGKVWNKEQFRNIGDGLYEVKGGRFRLIGYFHLNHFVLTHGFEKRGGGKAANKVPPNERGKEESIRNDYGEIFKKIRQKNGKEVGL